MTALTNFLHRLTGLETNTVTKLTPHFQRRLAYLGGIMAFTCLTNGGLLTFSLAINGYAAFPAILAGMTALTFTYMVERFIVTSTKSLTGMSLAYRTLLFLVMVGLHLVFVDLAFFRSDLQAIAWERFEERKEFDIARYDDDFQALDAKMARTLMAIDTLDADKQDRQDAALNEVRGSGATGKTGRGTIAIYEERAFDRYLLTVYQPDSSKLANRLTEYQAQRDTLEAAITAIKSQPFDYNEIGLVTKMTYLTDFASRPGNEAVYKIMLLLILFVGAIEFAPLYARHRLEFSEYRASYERQRQLNEAISEEAKRAELLAEQLKGEANAAAAAARGQYKNAEQKAEDRFAFAILQAEYIHRAEKERQQARQELPKAGIDLIDGVFDRLITDLLLLFSAPNPNL